MSGGRGRYMSGFCARFLKAVTGEFVILKFRLCEMWRKKLQFFSLEVKSLRSENSETFCHFVHHVLPTDFCFN